MLGRRSISIRYRGKPPQMFLGAADLVFTARCTAQGQLDEFKFPTYEALLLAQHHRLVRAAKSPWHKTAQLSGSLGRSDRPAAMP